MNKLEFITTEKENLGKLLKKYLPLFSKFQIEQLFKNKDIKVNGVRKQKPCELRIGDKVEVYYKEIDNTPWYKTVYEDENVLIVNKRGGIEVISEDDRDLVSILSLERVVYPIHRIDRNTEGLVMFAKTQEAEIELLQAFKERTITKKYLLECAGKVNVDAIKPKLYLKKMPETSKVIISEVKTSGYEEIKTVFKFVRYNGTNSLLEAELVTGKTHQIRAHISYYGHSIIGDGKYGKGDGNLHLTSYFIKFNLKGKLSYLNDMHFEIMPSWLN